MRDQNPSACRKAPSGARVSDSQCFLQKLNAPVLLSVSGPSRKLSRLCCPGLRVWIITGLVCAKQINAERAYAVTATWPQCLGRGARQRTCDALMLRGNAAHNGPYPPLGCRATSSCDSFAGSVRMHRNRGESACLPAMQRKHCLAARRWWLGSATTVRIHRKVGVRIDPPR